MPRRDEISTTAEAHEASALRYAGVVHTDPDTPATCEQKPLPEPMTRKPYVEKTPAQWAYERLILYIRNFESQLDAEHEVVLGFAGSDAGVLQIEGIGYFEPDIVTFYGSDEGGRKTQLIQHVGQLNVILRAIPRGDADDPPRRIGFRLAVELEDSAGDRPEEHDPRA
ncbi:MAG: DUF6173 family protein [Gemmobacter sp.]